MTHNDLEIIAQRERNQQRRDERVEWWKANGLEFCRYLVAGLIIVIFLRLTFAIW
jgi:hypothetical protein